MPHVLPPLGHPAREMFDDQHLVDVAMGKSPIPWSIHALRKSARELFDRNPAARRAVFFRVNPSNDDLELVSVGRRGGWKREWVFGPCGRNVRLD